jgi:hypothetical protein
VACTTGIVTGIQHMVGLAGQALGEDGRMLAQPQRVGSLRVAPGRVKACIASTVGR